MTALIIFKSRAQALDCVSFLRREGIPAQAVSTPQEARVGCGLSVKIEDSFFPKAKLVLPKKNYSALAGFMRGGRWT